MTQAFGKDIDPPAGTIAVWSRPLSEIPAGWVLCDGSTTGTPNLLDDYVKSVPNASTDPGSTGGQHSYSLSTGQLASHNHSGSGTTTDGKHSHKYTVTVYSYTTSESYNNWMHETDEYTENAGSHSHGLSLGSSGSGSSIDNRPNTEEIAFIIKT